MRREAAWAQLDLAGTPPGWGYKVGGVQFENFIDGKLVDVKDWQPFGIVMRLSSAMSMGPF